MSTMTGSMVAARLCIVAAALALFALAALLLSLSLRKKTSQSARSLLTLTALIWLSAILMVAMMFGGPSKAPNADGPALFPGWPNRCSW